MAFMWISTYVSAAEVAHGLPDFQKRYAVTGASQQTDVPSSTDNRRVEIMADVAIQYQIGTSPSVTADSNPLPANVIIYKDLPRGHRIAYRTPLP